MNTNVADFPQTDSLAAAIRAATEESMETGKPAFRQVDDLKIMTDPPYSSEPARPFPTVPVIAGSLIGLAVAACGSWWMLRRYRRRQAEAAAALVKGNPATPTPRPAPVAAAA